MTAYRCAILFAVAVLAVAGCGKPSPPAIALDVSGAPKDEPARGKRFAFPTDEGGKVLAELLAAENVKVASPQMRSERLRFPVPPALAQPEIRLPLDVAQGALPRVWLVMEHPKKKTLPRMSPTEPPLLQYVYERAPGGEFPVGPLTRLPSVDVDRPLRVPTLAGPIADRASLEDPTADFSLAAVLSTAPPERTNPAPVWFLNLPDPFEYHHIMRMLVLPPEDAAPRR